MTLLEKKTLSFLCSCSYSCKSSLMLYTVKFWVKVNLHSEFVIFQTSVIKSLSKRKWVSKWWQENEQCSLLWWNEHVYGCITLLLFNRHTSTQCKHASGGIETQSGSVSKYLVIPAMSSNSFWKYEIKKCCRRSWTLSLHPLRVYWLQLQLKVWFSQRVYCPGSHKLLIITPHKSDSLSWTMLKLAYVLVYCEICGGASFQLHPLENQSHFLLCKLSQMHLLALLHVLGSYCLIHIVYLRTDELQRQRDLVS